MADDLASLGFKPIPQNELEQFGFQSELAPHVPTSTSTPGMLEAGARGLEQGATLGFGDEINGGLSTLLDSLSGKNKNLGILEDYVKQRDESRAKFKAAQEAHPYISGAGNLVGGLAPALLTGGASLPEQGLMGAAKLGAGYGALGGLGTSEADLTKGQVGQAAKDVATGGVMGGLLGGAVQGAANQFGDVLTKGGSDILGAAGAIAKTPTELPVVNKTMEAFKQGALENRKLYGVNANHDLQNTFINESQGLSEGIDKAKLQAIIQKRGLQESAPNLDMNPWMKGAGGLREQMQTEAVADPAAATEVQRFRDYIKRWAKGAPAEQDEDGNVLTPALKGAVDQEGMASVQAVEKLKRKLATWSTASDKNPMKTPEARELVTRVLSGLEDNPEGFTALKPMMNEAVPGLDEVNTQISTLSKAQKAQPSLNTLMNAAKTTQSGTTAQEKLQDFFGLLPPDVLPGKREQLMSLAKARDVANAINAPGLSHGLIANTASGIALTGANMAGLAARGLYDMAPDAVRTLSQNIAAMGTKAGTELSNILAQAAERDNIGRNALFFAIQQNPEYRQILQNASGGTPQPK